MNEIVVHLFIMMIMSNYQHDELVYFMCDVVLVCKEVVLSYILSV